MSNKVIPVLFLLQASEGHFCTRDVLLGVLEILKEGLLVPNNTLVHVGGGVGEAFSLASLTTKDTRSVRQKHLEVYK